MASDDDGDVIDAIHEEIFRAGRAPTSARVYGYVLRPGEAMADVCSPELMDSAELTAATSGYRRAKVNSATELAAFLAEGVDLLSAECDGKALVLAGRRRSRAEAAPITLEHIAALAQDHGHPHAKIGFSLDHKQDEFDSQAALADVRSLLEGLRANTLHTLFQTWDIEPHLLDRLVATRVNRPALQLELEHLARQLEGGAASASAASLSAVVTRPKYIGWIAEALVTRHSRQCARYDGRLQGTETGMTLFYTDLLAKLWFQNWGGSAPEGPVAGFRSLAHQGVPVTECGNQEESWRIWFGLRTEGVLLSEKQLAFAPSVTRLFAAGEGATEGQELRSHGARSLLEWWSRNYSSVAAWEGQYELLNQIMKWATVLNPASNVRACAARLLQRPVASTARFDQWMSARVGRLRFEGPIRLRENAGATECLSYFVSDPHEHCGTTMFISGGVNLNASSLASRRRARSLPALPASIDSTETPHEVSEQRVHYTLLARPDSRLHDVQVKLQTDGARVEFSLEAKSTNRGLMETWLLPEQQTSARSIRCPSLWKLHSPNLAICWSLARSTCPTTTRRARGRLQSPNLAPPRAHGS